MPACLTFVFLFCFLGSSLLADSTDPLSEAFDASLKSLPSFVKHRKINKPIGDRGEKNKAIKDRKELSQIILHAHAFHAPKKFFPEYAYGIPNPTLHTTKSNLKFYCFRGTSGYSAHYLVISHSLLFQKWKFNFHDNLSRQFLDKIGVHKGIESLAIEVYEHAGFKDIVKNNKKYVTSIPFVVIGHDLGGAVAALLAMKLKTEGCQIRAVTTFGQPKFTDAAGAILMDSLPITRVTIEADLISRLPANNSIYKHFGRSLKLDDSSYFFYPNSIPENMLIHSKAETNQLEQIIESQTEIYLNRTLDGLTLYKSKLIGLDNFAELVLDTPVISHDIFHYISTMEKHRTILNKFWNDKYEFPGRRVGSSNR